MKKIQGRSSFWSVFLLVTGIGCTLILVSGFVVTGDDDYDPPPDSRVKRSFVGMDPRLVRFEQARHGHRDVSENQLHHLVEEGKEYFHQRSTRSVASSSESSVATRKRYNNYDKFNNDYNRHYYLQRHQEEHTCGSISAKNSVDQLAALENCTVIEGSLTIAIMDRATAAEFANLTFPRLVEITEYLVIYRVQGLQSLGRLFPNLAVIRGNQLFNNYALIIFDVSSLLNLGLGNLTSIERGGVRIEKNPNLCFADTIDWDSIAPPFKGVKRVHVIRTNKPRNQCPRCNSTCPLGISAASSSSISGQSSRLSSLASSNNPSLDNLCWNEEVCQRVCNCSVLRSSDGTEKVGNFYGLRTCNVYNSSLCCDYSCVGGCIGPGPEDCLACKKIKHLVKKDASLPPHLTCVKECPTPVKPGDVQLLEYKGRRCIDTTECIRMSMPDPKDANKTIQFKAFGTQFKCLPECPAGFQVNGSDPFRCEKCPHDHCPKYCESGLITNAEQAQAFKGCNIINGSLQIEVRGADIITELEQNLGDIEEIMGSLRVSRSHRLISLHFLKKLKLIRGKFLERGSYSLLVYDNPNLKELFHSKSIKIEQGNIFFHLNPYLCLSKIYELSFFEKKEANQNDVSVHTNGEKAACDIIPIGLNITEITNAPGSDLYAKWDDIQKQLHDPRSLISYQIYYRKASTNVTKYDGRDACTTSEWKYIEYPVDSSISKSEIQAEATTVSPGQQNQSKRMDTAEYPIPHLKPFTRYAFYIQTYTVSVGPVKEETIEGNSLNLRFKDRFASRGGESDIVYFTTAPKTPSLPEIDTLEAKSESEILVKWKKPQHPNGIIRYYKITVTGMTTEAIPQHDYCGKPLAMLAVYSGESSSFTSSSSSIPSVNPASSSKTVNSSPLPDKYMDSSDQCCQQCKRKLHGNDEEDRDDFISFENYIMNEVFKVNENTRREQNIRTYGSQDPASVPGNKTKRSPQDKTSSKAKRSVDGSLFDDQSLDFSKISSTVSSSVVSAEINTTESSTSTSNSTSSNPTDETGTSTDQQTTLAKKETFSKRFRIEATEEEFQTFVISNLTHFTLFKVEISACQDENPRNLEPCSDKNYQFVQTMASKTADLIQGIRVNQTSSNSTDVIVSWDEPKNPNAVIVSFQITYDIVGKEANSLSLPTRCIRYQDSKISNHSVKLADIPPGNYLVSVRANSLAGPGNWSEPRTFTIYNANATPLWITLLIFCCAVFFIGLVTTVSIVYVKKTRQSIPNYLDYVTMNAEYMSAYEPDEWEIPREKIVIGKRLGNGSFGRVFEGIVKDFVDGVPEVKCAVKMVNDYATPHDKLQFLKEATIMKNFQCHHVVKLLGVSSVGNPVLVIMELLPLGDLKNFLRRCRDDYDGEGEKFPKPTKLEVHLMACQIADGMAYLAARKYAHRDLACRNIFLNEDRTVKVGDFGMTRDIYDTDYYRKGDKGMLPVRWMAPESIRDAIFTSQSDVWSFGVVLWEICTLAEQPYQGLSNDQVFQFVKQGGTPCRPEDCPEDLHSHMRLCWNWNPKARPTFPELVEYLYSEVRGTEEGLQFEQRSYLYNLREKEREETDAMNASVAGMDDTDQESMPLNPLITSRASSGGGDATVDSSATVRTIISDKEKAGSEPSSKEYLFKFSNIIPASFKTLLARSRNNGSRTNSNNSSRDGSRAAAVAFDSDNSKETVVTVPSVVKTTSFTTNVASRIVVVPGDSTSIGNDDIDQDCILRMRMTNDDNSNVMTRNGNSRSPFITNGYPVPGGEAVGLLSSSVDTATDLDDSQTETEDDSSNVNTTSHTDLVHDRIMSITPPVGIKVVPNHSVVTNITNGLMRVENDEEEAEAWTEVGGKISNKTLSSDSGRGREEEKEDEDDSNLSNGGFKHLHQHKSSIC